MISNHMPVLDRRNFVRLLLCLAVFGFGNNAVSAEFSTTVSSPYADPNVVLNLTNSTMDTAWFTERAGGRTVFSNDVQIGILVHGAGTRAIHAHATWVIRYDPKTNTVNLNAGRTHITNWYFDQRCEIYEDGTCNCHNNPNWAICQYPPMTGYVQSLVAASRAAAINATHALQAQGVHVTRDP